MTADGQELRVYSVGMNCVDDGGVETSRRDDYRVNYEGKPDVVFSIRLGSMP